jgi:glycosyltransferase involved in cell wall biosynthesis
VKILVVSNLYPPVVRGGYELECRAVSEHLRRTHAVTILTSRLDRDSAPPGEEGVRRDLPFLEHTFRHSLAAPAWAIEGTRAMRRTLSEVDPDLVFVWNGAQIPHAALRVALDGRRRVAFRVCEPWFGRLFSGDQFMRHLLPGDTGARAVWALGMRALNRRRDLRLDPRRRTRAAVSWNSRAVREITGVPSTIEPALERVLHPTTPNWSAFAAARRAPVEHGVVIAFVGRVDHAKGADVAVRALGILRSRYGVDAVLRMAGPADGATTARIRSQHRAVELLGWRSPQEVAALLATADALVVPSTAPEAFGLVCVEGALARVPMVASRIGGIPECLHDEEHAILVPPEDADALAAALARTLSEREATADRVARAHARVMGLSLQRYLAESERFVEDAATTLGHPSCPSVPAETYLPAARRAAVAMRSMSRGRSS